MSKPSAADRDRAIDRIKKCLRLAESSEPWEAAAALRQAQKLMNSMGLTEADIDAAGIKAEVVKTKEAFGGCPYLAQLVNLVQQAFGVIAVWEPGAGKSRVRANIRYIGPIARVQLAVYAHRVLTRAIAHAWDEFLLDNPEKMQRPGARAAFRLAFLTGVESKVQKLAPTEHEFRQVNAYLQSKYGTGMIVSDRVKSKGELDFDAYVAGANKAMEFELNRPIEAELTGLEWMQEPEPS